MGSAPSKRSSYRRGRAPPGNTDGERPSRRRGTGQEEANPTRRSDFSAQLRETLMSYNDTQLYRVTRYYRPRLQATIEQFVDELSSALSGRTILRMEDKRVQELVAKGEHIEAAQYLLDTVMKNGARVGRQLWAILVKMTSSKPQVRALLKDLQQHGPKLPFLVTWSHLESELPDYQTVIWAAQQRHKEKLREELERLEAETDWEPLSSVGYPVLVTILSQQEEGLLAHEQLARSSMRESVLKEEAENEVQERRQRGHFSKQPMCPVSPRRELFGQGFCAGRSGGLTLLGGAARVGKTATLRRLVGEWASVEADTGPEAVYPQFQFLLHFELEREMGDQPSSLQALVQSAYPHLSDQLPYLWQTPEALLLIFDGLDRLHGWHDASPGMITKDPTEGCPLPDMLWSLARGALLPGCCVLFSGRPTALKPLEIVSPRLWLEVAGLDEGVRRAYALGLHRGQSEQVEEALTQAQQNEYLWDLCADPGYCWLVCSGLGEGPTPRTATQVLAAYLHRVLRQRAEADPRDLLFRAGELALEGLSQQKGLFAEEDLRRHGLEPLQLERGLIQRALGRSEGLYAFCQPPLQEFMAALAQYLAPERRDLLQLLQATQAADDGRYQGFLRFLLGLSARVSSRQLEEFLLPLPHRSICEVISWLESLVQTETKKRELSRHHLLTMAHYLHEGRNRRLARLLAASISRMKLGDEHPQHGIRLDPPDCAALCYVFQHCESVDNFSFENCYIQAEGIKYLLAAFLNCKRISLIGNNLRDEGVRILCVVLRDPDCKVIEIDLAKNNLTRACTDDLLSAIVSNTSIIGLSLNKNNLGDIGAIQLVEGLQYPDCKIDVLQLQGNHLTEACTQSLNKMILALSNLTWMILDHNELGDSGVHNLCTGIRSSRLHRLGFGFNSLTDLASNELVGALCVNRTIQFLRLTSNYFTQQSVSSFVTLIRTCQRLRKLWLGKNLLSAEDKQVLQAEQANRPSLKLML